MCLNVQFSFLDMVRPYSVLWAINGVVIFAVQPLIMFLSNTFFKSLRIQLVFGSVMFIFSMVILLIQPSYSSFVLSMIVITIGEIFIWAGVPTIANQLAPNHKKGFYQGIVNACSTLGRTIGPLIGGVLYGYNSYKLLFTCMIIIAFLSMVCFWLYEIKDNQRKAFFRVKIGK
ncbi:MFS transporter [Bacillus pseudomycoides]|uniref:MFS transporter n=1 Tax=Bacillus pseudomycoides TaxID=64104 RepID=UPI0015D4BFAA|nr:MFS transporter [Bacillus pseudomycoides]